MINDEHLMNYNNPFKREKTFEKKDSHNTYLKTLIPNKFLINGIPLKYSFGIKAETSYLIFSYNKKLKKTGYAPALIHLHKG